ncbi:MAG: hypothetical protein JWR32_3280 [Mycobacterium sp.]|nr:hypothetical protein [Mycobacterium sp.]
MVWADPNDPRGLLRAPRDLLNLLPGKPVVVRRTGVDSALWRQDRPLRPVRLPWDRSVRFVQVSADDRIKPARDLDPHRDGQVAEAP